MSRGQPGNGDGTTGLGFDDFATFLPISHNCPNYPVISDLEGNGREVGTPTGGTALP